MREAPPFGKAFHYTDTAELPGNFADTNKSRPSWWHRWRLRHAFAWVLIERDDNKLVTANIVPPATPMMSQVSVPSAALVYDKRLIFVSDDFMKEHP